jgi:dinuclear metal center YbgI/SA1388 family protein
MTTKISEVIACIEQMAPLAYQESWDNSGVQVGDVNQVVKAVLLCVDITEATLDEAIERGANLIISHHPLIFKGIKKLTGRNYIERVIIKAIQHNIVLYSAHTNMDKCLGGVNFRIAQKLGLNNIRVLAPEENYLSKIVTFVPQSHIEQVRQAMWSAGAGTIGAYDCCSYSSEGNGTFRAQVGCNPFVGEIGKLHTEPELRLEMIVPKDKLGRVVAAIHSAHPYEEPAIDILPLSNNYEQLGLGCVGDLENPITETEMLNYIKEKLGVQYIRHTKTSDKLVSRVALCGGSGAEFIPYAIREKAGIYITADVKYHDFFNTENQIVIADIGHFESEECIKEVFYEQLSKNFINFAILKAVCDKSPVLCSYRSEY